MNWDEIKQKYPKAYDNWITWNQVNYNTAPAKDAVYILMVGSLFQFFDEQGILMGVNAVWETWLQTVEEDYEYYEFDGYTRQEAEQQAFTKAFEILENKLN